MIDFTNIVVSNWLLSDYFLQKQGQQNYHIYFMIDSKMILDWTTWSKGLFINYVSLFKAFLDPHPPLCQAPSAFGLPPPPPHPNDVIYEQDSPGQFDDFWRLKSVIFDDFCLQKIFRIF